MERDLKELLDEARVQFKAGDYPAAERLLEEALPRAREWADVHNMLGVIRHDVGKFGKALESFQEALRINPNYTEALLNLSVTYNDLGMYEQARAVFARATQTSKPTRAPESFTGDEPVDPFVKGKLANMHADLGSVYAQLLQFGSAIAEYRRALELRPDFADIRTSLGKVLRDSGRKDEACVELERAHADRPRYATAGVQLGVTYYSLGRNDDARRLFQEVIDNDPENASARMFLQLVTEMAKNS